MKLSRTCTYALQAVLQLTVAADDRPVPCRRLAAEGQMPERFLLQILRSLVTHQILASTRGVEGGYMLGRAASTLSLLDIVEAVDGPLTGSALPSAESLPAGLRARLERIWADINCRTRSVLAEVKISELAADGPCGTADEAAEVAAYSSFQGERYS